jgi:hypothetical protein
VSPSQFLAFRRSVLHSPQTLAIALILLMQGPAMLVQEVAWVKMLVSYTQERGLKRGVIETFDGKHPCKLCKKAAEIRQQEQPQDPAEKQAPHTTPAPRMGGNGRQRSAENAGDRRMHDISVPLDRRHRARFRKRRGCAGSPPPSWADCAVTNSMPCGMEESGGGQMPAPRGPGIPRPEPPHRAPRTI